MYKVFFSVDNNAEKCILPIVPVDFPISLQEQHNEIYSGLSCDYNRIGTLGLRKMSWSSFFPVCRHRQPYMPEGAKTDGWWYIHFFERWRNRKIPFRIMVWDNDGNDLRLNMPCTVDSLEYTIAQNGYINYTISITEYRFVTGD